MYGLSHHAHGPASCYKSVADISSEQRYFIPRLEYLMGRLEHLKRGGGCRLNLTLCLRRGTFLVGKVLYSLIQCWHQLTQETANLLASDHDCVDARTHVSHYTPCSARGLVICKRRLVICKIAGCHSSIAFVRCLICCTHSVLRSWVACLWIGPKLALAARCG